MKTHSSVRTLVLFVAAFGAFASTALAATSEILNKLEVQKLVASAAPADQARVAAHFSALADRKDAEAATHRAMASGSAGNINRPQTSAIAPHCTRLAALNEEAATVLRELAEHHRKLADGILSEPPAAGAKYQGGEGAGVPTEKELALLAASARTVSDHRALQEYFQTAARRYTTEANEHQVMSQSYRGTRIATAAAHCDRLVHVSRDAAKEATAAAAMHEQLVNAGR